MGERGVMRGVLRSIACLSNCSPATAPAQHRSTLEVGTARAASLQSLWHQLPACWELWLPLSRLAPQCELFMYFLKYRQYFFAPSQSAFPSCVCPGCRVFISFNDSQEIIEKSKYLSELSSRLTVVQMVSINPQWKCYFSKLYCSLNDCNGVLTDFTRALGVYKRKNSLVSWST